MNKQSIEIGKINHPPELQMRVGLSTEHTEDLRQALYDGAELPPVLVYCDVEGVYWLADGHHTLAAYKLAKLDTIPCIVRPGDMTDAQWAATAANKTHGLKRTQEDKVRAIKIALAHPNAKDMSNRDIAAHIGVDHKTVGKVRESIGQASPNQKPKSEHAPKKDNPAPVKIETVDAQPESGEKEIEEKSVNPLDKAQESVRTLIGQAESLSDDTAFTLGVSKNEETRVPYMGNYQWTATVGVLQDFIATLKRGMPVGGTPTKPVSQYQQDIKNKVKK